jgi:hypothetical protein
VIEATTKVPEHRGPDDSGVWTNADATVVLGSRRLSILDLSAAGHMPMLSDDDHLALTYNGEIYHFRELRALLESRGHTFRSNTDTEVLIHGHEEWGRGLLKGPNGTFASRFGMSESVLSCWPPWCSLVTCYQRRGVEDAIAFAGVVAPAKRRELLETADVLVVPPRCDEGQPLVASEGLSADLPIVATASGGLAEAAREGVEAIIVPKRDPVAIAAAVTRLLQDPTLRMRMGAAACARFESEYTLDRWESRKWSGRLMRWLEGDECITASHREVARRVVGAAPD